MTVVDILRHKTHDLLDQAIWEDVMRSFRSRWFAGLLSSAPCGTFSIARTGQGGPSPLRAEQPPDIYGLPNLRPHDKEKVRVGTLLAVRAAEISGVAADLKARIPVSLQTTRVD